MQLRSDGKQTPIHLDQHNIEQIIIQKQMLSVPLVGPKHKPKIHTQIILVSNDGSRPALKTLLSLKGVISKQLPKMPRQYITKVLFDGRHQCLSMLANDRIIGGACFRCFDGTSFAELVFLAIDRGFRDCGLGSKLIDSLKELLQGRSKELLLTYADYTAIGFFRKQAFQFTIETPQKQWSGYIKPYEGGRLMECRVDQQFKYTHFRETVAQQKHFLIQKIKYQIKTLQRLRMQNNTKSSIQERSSFSQQKQNKYVHHTQKNPFREEGGQTTISVNLVPGGLQNGWCQSREDNLQKQSQISLMLQQLHAIQCIRKFSSSRVVLDIQKHSHLANTSTFSTLQKKIINGKCYTSAAVLCQDVRTMIIEIKNYCSEEQMKKIEDVQKKMQPILQLLISRRLQIQLDTLFKEGRSKRIKTTKLK